MLRSRIIRPGIATNEVLAALGPYAEILFTRLWMLADREGRLEDRPAKIKAEGMPYYDIDPDDLLEKLWKSGLILRYTVRRNRVPYRFIQIQAFTKHQYVHPHEPPSVIPKPPVRPRKQAASQSDKNVRNVITCHDIGEPCTLVSFSFSNTVDSSSSVEDSGVGAKAKTSPPLTPENQNIPAPTPPTPGSATPEHASCNSGTRQAGIPETAAALASAIPEKRKPMTRAGGDRPSARTGPIDWWPHQLADVDVVRASLRDMAALVRMAPPDDQIVRRVLDVARGAPGEDIHAVLAALYKRNKFRGMYSWGFVPAVLADHFRVAS